MLQAVGLALLTPCCTQLLYIWHLGTHKVGYVRTTTARRKQCSYVLKYSTSLHNDLTCDGAQCDYSF
jgi:hypothetical protein